MTKRYGFSGLDRVWTRLRTLSLAMRRWALAAAEKYHPSIDLNHQGAPKAARRRL